MFALYQNGTRCSVFRAMLTLAIIYFALPAVMFAQVPSSSHVVLVIDENHSYSEVRSNMTWLVGQGNANGYATNYHSNSSGSLLDYLWLASGSCESDQTLAACTLPAGTHDFQCTGDHCASAITDDNIFREMNNHGVAWKVYAQSYTAAGGTVTTPDNNNGTSYYRRHNGATWYSDILNNVNGSQSNIVDFSQFATDLANNALPRFAIIVPDGAHDAHDCPNGAAACLQAADSFLNTNLSPMLSKSYFQSGGDGLLIVTFDECGNGTNGGCAASVYTAVIGPKVKPNTVSSTSYQHQNTLRTIMDALQLTTYPGAAASATDMNDFFGSGGGTGGVTIGAPSATVQESSPIPFNATATSNGLPITSMKVYLDGNPTEIGAYTGNGTSSLTVRTTYTMGTGTHTLNVNAWDSGGTIYQSQVTFTVAATGVAIGSPGNGAQVTGASPFSATATSNGLPITAIKVYLDFDTTEIATYNGNGTSTLFASAVYSFSTGPHVLIVNAWDTAGKVYRSAVSLNVSLTGVVVNAPGGSAQVTGGVPFQATATSNGSAITAMKVYLDYNSTPIATFNGNSTSTLSASSTLSVANGSHTLIVNAWDSGGQIYQSAVGFTESATGVVINSPAANSQVTAPVAFSATATSNGAAISAMKVYLDYNSTEIGTFNGNGTSTLTGQNAYSMAAGAHTIITNAWDSSGQLYQSAVSFTSQ
jgi:hypothetical protein